MVNSICDAILFFLPGPDSIEMDGSEGFTMPVSELIILMVAGSVL